MALNHDTLHVTSYWSVSIATLTDELCFILVFTCFLETIAMSDLLNSLSSAADSLAHRPHTVSLPVSPFCVCALTYITVGEERREDQTPVGITRQLSTNTAHQSQNSEYTGHQHLLKDKQLH